MRKLVFMIACLLMVVCMVAPTMAGWKNAPIAYDPKESLQESQGNSKGDSDSDVAESVETSEENSVFLENGSVYFPECAENFVKAKAFYGYYILMDTDVIFALNEDETRFAVKFNGIGGRMPMYMEGDVHEDGTVKADDIYNGLFGEDLQTMYEDALEEEMDWAPISRTRDSVVEEETDQTSMTDSDDRSVYFPESAENFVKAKVFYGYYILMDTDVIFALNEDETRFAVKFNAFGGQMPMYMEGDVHEDGTVKADDNYNGLFGEDLQTMYEDALEEEMDWAPISR